MSVANFARLVVLPASLVLLAGCVPNAITPSTPAGDSLASAKPLMVDESGAASVSGNITGSKIDVYDLGAAAVGDRIQVTILAPSGSNLDPLAALFNANGELYFLNDDRDLDGGDLNSAIDALVRTASGHFFLCVTRSTFGSTSGTYNGTVQISRGVGAPRPAVQYLLLDFKGGSISVPHVGNFNMTAFDAADINSAYTGKTAEIKAQIVVTVKQNYARFGLQVVTSDDPPPPPNCFTTLFFGAFSEVAFGMSEDVDHENLNMCDDGVIFTDKFSDPFATLPSVTGIGTAIGNVAAHECGHLLGLEHVDDITDLMDTTGTASTLLADQEFKTAPLDKSIFPFGKQNGVLLLNEVIPP